MRGLQLRVPGTARPGCVTELERLTQATGDQLGNCPNPLSTDLVRAINPAGASPVQPGMSPTYTPAPCRRLSALPGRCPALRLQEAPQPQGSCPARPQHPQIPGVAAEAAPLPVAGASRSSWLPSSGPPLFPGLRPRLRARRAAPDPAAELARSNDLPVAQPCPGPALSLKAQSQELPGHLATWQAAQLPGGMAQGAAPWMPGCAWRGDPPLSTGLPPTRDSPSPQQMNSPGPGSLVRIPWPCFHLMLCQPGRRGSVLHPGLLYWCRRQPPGTETTAGGITAVLGPPADQAEGRAFVASTPLSPNSMDGRGSLSVPWANGRAGSGTGPLSALGSARVAVVWGSLPRPPHAAEWPGLPARYKLGPV